jgi:deoxycytidylate deaminase
LIISSAEEGSLERLRNNSRIRTVNEKPVALQWVSDDNVKNSSNTISSTCAPCDLCDPNILETGKKSEVSIYDVKDTVEKSAEKDPESTSIAQHCSILVHLSMSLTHLLLTKLE